MSVLSPAQMEAFATEMECDLAGVVESLGRFRFNVFRQRGEVAMVARFIPSQIPSIEALKMPGILKELTLLKRGLLLIVGAAGSGKSTTVAAMLDHRNAHTPGHILCIEDPIEFMHSQQREVGIELGVTL